MDSHHNQINIFISDYYDIINVVSLTKKEMTDETEKKDLILYYVSYWYFTAKSTIKHRLFESMPDKYFYLFFILQFYQLYVRFPL